MHKTCYSFCGGELIKYSENSEEFKYICNKCGRIITQKKRKPKYERRKVILLKHDWEKISKVIDIVAEKKLIDSPEEYIDLAAIRDKILAQCLPKPKIRKFPERKRKRRKIEKAIEGEEKMLNSRKVNWDDLLNG